MLVAQSVMALRVVTKQLQTYYDDYAGLAAAADDDLKKNTSEYSETCLERPHVRAVALDRWSLFTGPERGSNEPEKQRSGCSQRLYPTGFLHELVPLLKLAWPIELTLLTQYTFGLVAVYFCGHIGKLELDAVSLANSLINVLGLAIPLGLSSACDTLFSQIYGSSNKKLAGVVLQRSVLILFLAVLPCLALHLNATNLLIAIGQEPVISRLAGDYLLIFLPAILFFTLFIVSSKYLQSQNIVYPSMIFGIIANGTNILLHYILLYPLNMGLTGSAIAQTVSYIFMCALNVGYILITKVYKETWSGWSLECFQEWGQFATLALFGFLMTCIEWWSFELGIFLTGIKGSTELGVQSVIFQFEVLYSMFPFGLSIATSICVGIYMGAGKPQAAKTVGRVGLTVAVMLGTTAAIIFVLGRNVLPSIFTNVPEVVEMASDVLPTLALFSVFDALSFDDFTFWFLCIWEKRRLAVKGPRSVCSGIMRGLGRQLIGAIVIGLGYASAMAIGIPLLFLTKLSVQGFWIGLASALTLNACCYLTFLSRLNWDKEVDLAKERTKRREHVTSTSTRKCDENTALLESSTGESEQTEFTDSVENISKSSIHHPEKQSLQTGHSLTTLQLLFRRGIVFAFSFGVLIIGIICRILFPPVH